MRTNLTAVPSDTTISYHAMGVIDISIIATKKRNKMDKSSADVRVTYTNNITSNINIMNNVSIKL